MVNNKKETIEIVETSDDELIDDQGITENQKKSSKKNMNLIELCNQLERDLTLDFRKHREQIRRIKKTYEKELKKCNKRKKKTITNDKAGINKAIQVPDKLADLVGIPRGTSIPRTKLGGLVYKVFQDRDLLYDNDKRVMRVDNELQNIFGVSSNVNKSINPKDKVDVGINFYNLHTYIKRCYEESNNSTNSNQNKLNLNN